jgi:hypothetical protein
MLCGGPNISSRRDTTGQECHTSYSLAYLIDALSAPHSSTTDFPYDLLNISKVQHLSPFSANFLLTFTQSQYHASYQETYTNFLGLLIGNLISFKAP